MQWSEPFLRCSTLSVETMTLKDVKRWKDHAEALSNKTRARAADFLGESLGVSERGRASEKVRASEIVTLEERQWEASFPKKKDNFQRAKNMPPRIRTIGIQFLVAVSLNKKKFVRLNRDPGQNVPTPSLSPKRHGLFKSLDLFVTRFFSRSLTFCGEG